MSRVAAVRIPVALRVDAATACGNGVVLLDAFARGVDRAVGNAHEALADLSPGCAVARAATVRFTWTGADAEEVPPPMRRRLERALELRVNDLLRERVPAARRAARSPARRNDRFDEPAEQSRWTASGEYLVPSYDEEGRAVPLAVDEPASSAGISVVEMLKEFTSFDEVYEDIRLLFPDPAPRGGRYCGIYGIWSETAEPALFWLKEAKPPFIRVQKYVAVDVDDGVVRGSNVPLGFTRGRIYRLRVLAKPKQHKNTDYWLERVSEDESNPAPVFLNHLKDELRGWEIHFGVALTEAFVITEKAPPEPSGMPPWQLWRITPLGWTPDNGVSPEVWKWYGWLNIQPLALRQDPLLKKIFEQWVREGFEYSLLQPYISSKRLYQEVCYYVALEMLAESRRNMEQFLQLIQQPDHPWAAQFDTVVRFLAPTGAQIVGMGDPGRLREVELAEAQRLLEYRESLFQSQEESLAAGMGGLPGGIILPSDLDALRAQIANIEAERRAATTALRKAGEVVKSAETLEPLLVVLTLQNGVEVRSVSAALADYAPGQSTEAPSEWVRREFGSLIGKSQQAERDVRDNWDKAYELALVRQVADRRLKGWLDANPIQAGWVQRLIEGMGILDWLVIGAALIAITFVCPPLGLGLSIGIGAVQLGFSVSKYARVSRLSRVRLSQYGFVPLASAAEVSAALLAVVLDTVFLFLDLKGAGRALSRGGRAAARGTLEAFEQGIEQVLAGVRRTSEWPEQLTAAVRRHIEEAAQGGALAGRSLDQAVEIAKAQMALRYERHIYQVRDELAVLLTRPDLTGEELRQFLTAKMRQPQDFLEELAQSELRPGKELWDAVDRRLASAAPIPPAGQAFIYLPPISAEAAEALRRELGSLADLLNDARLLKLGLALEVPYEPLAKQLGGLLRRTDDPARSLTLLENLLNGRSDAGAILQALGTQGRPGYLLEHLRPDLLDGLPGTPVQQLLEAMSRPTKAGTIERFYLHTRVGGDVALARDIVDQSGRLAIQRWAGPAKGWQVYRRAGPRPQPPISSGALRAAEESTLASVAEGSVAATRGLARLSQGGRQVLLEELEDHVIEPALVRRYLEAVAELPDRSLDALVAIHRADVASRAGGLLAETWIDVLEQSRGWRDDLLRLVGEVHDVVDNGLAEAVRRGMSGGTNIQGSLGHLHAAATLRREFPDARMSFEVAAPGREIDVVLHHRGRNLDIEVKTNLGDELTINTRQMRNDLLRHAGDRGHDLLYLYHPSSAARLGEVKAAMVVEARSVLSPEAAREVERRIDQIIRLYQLH